MKLFKEAVKEKSHSSPGRDVELDAKTFKLIISPLLESYGRSLTLKQWQHWSGVLGELKKQDLADAVRWWMNNKIEFPPSPAAIKSHALDQVRKTRSHERQLQQYDRLKADVPADHERLPPDQVRAYCKFIQEKMLDDEQRVRAPKDSNKARWYESQMEKFFDEENSDE